ncbi:uncharacterized protein LOC123216602 isoform X2 [Mangifera indica]|uniref:uncharacterized protein LOC123216602 isoform X2 n=1 Tax=Mangifera indica TaxID=29780 RepID=UPI001CFAE6B1|nr:uncharacterized protein LOC123216602 isoform X2 [Mangifera indica]
MWRQNNFPGDPDSDQSISDEGDYNVDLRENGVSMCGRKDEGEGLHLQSRLDVLRGAYDGNCGREFSSSSTKKQSSVLCEDEVEVPDFPDEQSFMFSPRKVSTCNTDDETISDDEENMLLKISVTSGVQPVHKDGLHNFLSGKQAVVNLCSTIGEEAEALIQSNEIGISSSSHSASEANKSCKGIKSKSRPNFSFHFQSPKDGNDVPFKVHEGPERLKTANSREHSFAELLEDFCGEKPKKSDIVSAEVKDLCFSGEHSVTELLDGLKDRTGLLKRNSKMYGRTTGKRIQVVKRSTSPLEDRTIFSEDLPEPIRGSSSDDEASHQELKPAFPEMKKQTIADKFQEALGASSSDKAALVTVLRTSGVGLFGKLQQVTQSEKLKDMNFLKLQGGASPNNPSCVNIRILSRYLDGKLIVCRVSFAKDIESIEWPEFDQTMANDGRERTIIFNPRVCRDVDLEAGKSIRIHPPWKEIQVRGDEPCSCR